MEIEITRHNVPDDEFKQLKNLYYRGKYGKNGNTEWFEVRIDMSIDNNSQFVTLTWFKEWRV